VTAATAAAEGRAPVVEEPTSAKVLRFLGKAPIHVLLVVVGVLWLVPTFGLLITSLISPEDFAEGGSSPSTTTRASGTPRRSAIRS
jgi:alpha-glucoside transport system permease protein